MQKKRANCYHHQDHYHHHHHHRFLVPAICGTWYGGTMVSFFKFHSSGSFSNSMPLLSLSVPGECHLAARGKNKLPRLAAQHANYGTPAVKLQIKKCQAEGNNVWALSPDSLAFESWYTSCSSVQGCSPKNEVGDEMGGRQTLEYMKRQ